MLEAYSVNVDVVANTPIPFNSVSLLKGCTATHPSADTISLNKCGVYMISFNGTAEASTTVQLYKNGVAQPQAQSTGTTPGFVTLVQVTENNTGCPCTAPTNIQIVNTTATTFTDANVVVTKLV